MLTTRQIVSAWTSKPTNFTLFIDRLHSLVALYCLSSNSQHNPRLRIGAGHSIVTETYELKEYSTIPLKLGDETEGGRNLPGATSDLLRELI